MSLSDFLDHDDVSEIVTKLKKADAEYYNNSDCIISDVEYDKLKDALRNADPDNPYLETIGTPLPESTAWKKRKHNMPMTSLNKCNISKEFVDWCKNHKDNYYIVQDKLDGISIDLEYNNGKIIAATTRGDGAIGQDILKNVVEMQNVKKTITGFTGNIRGEIVITKTDFHELLKHETELKNRRNTASGLAVRQDGSHTEYLTILYYDIIEEGSDFNFEHDKMFRIKQLGLNTSEYILCKSIDHVIEVMNNHITSLREKKNFDIDGLVVKINDIKQQEKMGYGNEGNPKGQIAWKFPNETASTKMVDMEWSMGRNGQITPVAIFENVFVAGAMISRASLGSYGEFKKLKLHKGDTIEISRRNDVIPHVEKVITPSKNPVFIAPSKCPECGKDLEIGDKKIICKNKSCSAHGLGDLMTWINALDIKGVGPAIIEKLYDKKIIQTPVDFYNSNWINSVRDENLMGEKVHTKISKQFDDMMKLPLDVFIDGLNIDNFGGSTTRSLMKQGHDSIQKILSLSKKQLAEVDGIGDIKAEQVYEGLKVKRVLIEQLFSSGISIIAPAIKIKGLPLSGKTILFTGTMTKGRKEMALEAKSFGGEIVERVSKELSILVVPDKAWSSDKTQKAKKLNIQTLTEEEYRQLL